MTRRRTALAVLLVWAALVAVGVAWDLVVRGRVQWLGDLVWPALAMGVGYLAARFMQHLERP